MPAPSTSPITKTVSIGRVMAGRSGVVARAAASGCPTAVVMARGYPGQAAPHPGEAPGSRRSAPWSARSRQHGVLVRVRRRAAAQQHERLRAVVDEPVLGAGPDDDGVAGPDGGLLAGEDHAAGAGGEEVDLL